MMRRLLFISTLFSLFFVTLTSCAQQKEHPWNKDQLKAPAELAEELKGGQEDQLLVVDMGPAGVIKDAVEIGPAEYAKNRKRLKGLLKDVPRDKEVVVYCGCCPFSKCPNSGPAFQILLDMGFKKPRLLNLPQNLKADWIDKGYPLEEE